MGILDITKNASVLDITNPKAEQPIEDVDSTDFLSQLKDFAVAEGAIVILVGKTTLGDNLGGFYRWDSTATGSEDTTFMNIIPSNKSATGRWVRIFQNAKAYPQGVMVNIGGIKFFYASGTTDANGQVTVNLTAENTAGGTALFTEIWDADGKPDATVATPNDTITGTGAVAANFKTVAYQFARGASTTLGSTLLAIAGMVIPGLRAAPAGIKIRVVIAGI